MMKHFILRTFLFLLSFELASQQSSMGAELFHEKDASKVRLSFVTPLPEEKLSGDTLRIYFKEDHGPLETVQEFSLADYNHKEALRNANSKWVFDLASKRHKKDVELWYLLEGGPFFGKPELCHWVRAPQDTNDDFYFYDEETGDPVYEILKSTIIPTQKDKGELAAVRFVLLEDERKKLQVCILGTKHGDEAPASRTWVNACKPKVLEVFKNQEVHPRLVGIKRPQPTRLVPSETSKK